MEEILDTKETFTLAKRAQGFKHAFRGVYVFVRVTPNVLLHALALILVVSLGFYFDITRVEWIAITFACGLVFVTEAVNTALEIDINLTSPEYHPYARDTKDVAAGAVLLASLTALTVGLIVFIPYVLYVTGV